MNISRKEDRMNRDDIAHVWLTDDAIYVELNNGQVGKKLFSNYNRLATATQAQKMNYRLSFFGIHWPDLDEDLSF